MSDKNFRMSETTTDPIPAFYTVDWKDKIQAPNSYILYMEFTTYMNRLQIWLLSWGLMVTYIHRLMVNSCDLSDPY